MNRQRDLFGYIPPEPPKLPTLVLHEPDNKQWNSMTRFLDGHNTKQNLLSYAEALNVWLGQYEVMRAKSGKQPVKATEVVDMAKSSTAKILIAQGLALVLADQQNTQDYLNTLSEPMKELWRTLLLNIYVSQTTAKDILNDDSDIIVEDRKYYYYSYQDCRWARQEMKWFEMARRLEGEPSGVYYREKETYITINSAIHCIFFPYFFPEASEKPYTQSQLPPEGHWRTMEFEADSHAHFQLFQSLMKQNQLPLKKKGIGIADMKRTLKKMALDEFYPADTNEFRQNLRAYGYLQMLALQEHCISTQKQCSYQDTLRNLFTSFKLLNAFLPYILYPHMKGLKQQFVEYGRENKLCEMLFTGLREEPEGWVCLRDVIVKIFSLNNGENGSIIVPLVYNPSLEDYVSELRNEYSGQFLTANHYVMEFGYTGLQMCTLLMASLGMAEVAFDVDMPCRVSPIENVTHLRLTPLGRYALSITSKYDCPEMKHEAYFELDPDRLIIRSLKDPNPYAQLLKDTSLPISRSRFETSAQSFLANCRSRSDVESKISIFRQFIANELPPLWEQFFQQLLQHCHPLKEDLTVYRHYTIDPKNSDLIQLINTDPTLRQLVIRAEGYRIMVKADDLRKFENQLKKHGYLL